MYRSNKWVTTKCNPFKIMCNYWLTHISYITCRYVQNLVTYQISYSQIYAINIKHYLREFSYASCKLHEEANQKSVTALEHDVTTRLLYRIFKSRHDKPRLCGDISSNCDQEQNDRCQISWLCVLDLITRHTKPSTPCHIMQGFYEYYMALD